jgi:hypothetical protein
MNSLTHPFTEGIEHIGTITQVGNTQVFGLARCPVSQHRSDLVYLNLAGPATSVEAVWAQLAQKKPVIFQPKAGSKGIFIQHGGIEGRDGSSFARFQRRIPGLQERAVADEAHLLRAGSR